MQFLYFYNNNFLSIPSVTSQSLISPNSLSELVVAAPPPTSSVHNLTDTIYNEDFMLVLTKGEKYIPTPPPLRDADLMHSVNDYIRRTRIRHYFSRLNTGKNTSDYKASLRIPNPQFQAPTANSPILLENYYTNIIANATRLLQATPRCNSFKITNSKANLCIQNSIKTIKLTPGIKISTADKNLGLTITTNEWYHKEAIAKLSDTKNYLPYIDRSLLPNSWITLRRILQKYDKLYCTNNNSLT